MTRFDIGTFCPNFLNKTKMNVVVVYNVSLHLRKVNVGVDGEKEGGISNKSGVGGNIEDGTF